MEDKTNYRSLPRFGKQKSGRFIVGSKFCERRKEAVKTPLLRASLSHWYFSCHATGSHFISGLLDHATDPCRSNCDGSAKPLACGLFQGS